MTTMRSVWTGGTVGCLIASPGDDGQQMMFAGTETGVLVSTDLGRTWQETSSNPVAFVETLAFSSPSGASRRLFAGGPVGLHQSDDEGVSWRSQFAAHVHSLTTFSGRHHEPCVIAGTERDGVLRSDDGGLTWESANPGLLDPTILALAVSSPRAGARTVFAGTTSGISISRNDGKAWRPGAGVGDEPVVQCLAVSPRWPEDRCAFAGTESSGLLRTDDGGLTWQPVPEFVGRGIPAIDTIDDGVQSSIAVATGREILLSTDGGQAWRHGGEVPGEIATLWLGTDDETLIVLAGLYDLGLVRLV